MTIILAIVLPLFPRGLSGHPNRMEHFLSKFYILVWWLVCHSVWYFPTLEEASSTLLSCSSLAASMMTEGLVVECFVTFLAAPL
jgi:hypothetical protein